MRGKRKLKIKAARPLEDRLLGQLLRKHPAVLQVLDEHGIHFCAGCYLTLFSSVKGAAAFHAVPDFDKFLGDLRRSLKK
ncbi:MAG: hypothetical protein A3G41_04940 [Elusimicrobia bacterium RIFCSPLOWO2_12_FULL_59_9]|nr:MAG: hypothetical protein A3G41_04940 [Elusimicrobia bacterium RIFCSPLOWO2_12_FULL_59_9]